MYPFYSQQDKRTGKFLLSTCGAAKQLSFLADRLASEMRWDVSVVLPMPWQTQDRNPFRCYAERVYIPADNAIQRIHWNTVELGRLMRGVDVAVCNHELMAIPMSAISKAKLVQMCSVAPDAMFVSAWDAADLVVAQGEYAASVVRGRTETPVTFWDMAYDEEAFRRTSSERPIDVLFVARCSASNYTHHLEFLDAMEQLSGLRVAFTDVTCYLRRLRPNLEYTTDYVDALFSSKVAVALNDNMYGGLSIREAVRAGCVPVMLDVPGYWDLVGRDWPFLVDRLDGIADVVRRAVISGVAAPAPKGSYQDAWPRIREDMETLC